MHKKKKQCKTKPWEKVNTGSRTTSAISFLQHPMDRENQEEEKTWV